MLTSDSKNDAKSTCYGMRLIDAHSEFIQIDSVEIEELTLQLKGILLFIRKQLLKNEQTDFDGIQQNVVRTESGSLDRELEVENNGKSEILSNSVLLMNGYCIDLIDKNEFLRMHLTFICLMMKTVIVFRCKGGAKCKFIGMIKDNCSQLKMLMIGNGVDDYASMVKCDQHLIVNYKQNLGIGNSVADLNKLVVYSQLGYLWSMKFKFIMQRVFQVSMVISIASLTWMPAQYLTVSHQFLLMLQVLCYFVVTTLHLQLDSLKQIAYELPNKSRSTNSLSQLTVEEIFLTLIHSLINITVYQ